MSISSLTSSAASQLAYTSRLSGTSSTSSTSGTQRTGDRPPPPDDGGGLISAIADALKSIGVAGTSSGTSSTDTAATATDDTTGTSTDTTANAAQALGTFLESLMGALHAQQGEDGAAPPYGEPPQGGPGTGGGPGKLSSDLQSLIAELGAETTTDAAGTEDTAAASTASTDTSVSTLQSSFKDLLTALGGDGSDSATQLSSFLQALAGKLPAAGSSGN